MNFTCFNKQDTAVFSIAVLSTGRTLTLGLVLALASFVGSAPAYAQQGSALSAVYGRGVHAYFAGNTSQAEQYFTQAIQAGSTDPRPYYYRAMVRLGQGRKFEAENDMRVGAAHEARNPGVQHSIGRSLQRLQGPGRRTLETFRRQARLDRLQQGQQQKQQRYQQLDRRGPSVLRREVPLPLEQLVQPPQGMVVVPEASVPYTDPDPLQSPIVETPQPMPEGSSMRGSSMREGSAAREGSDMREGSATRSNDGNAEADPFGVPAPVTPVDDPFGGDAPTAPEPSPAPSAPAEADAFGELPSPAPAEPAAPAEDDPFGSSSAPTPATEEMPQPEPQPAMPEEDAFGDDEFGGDAFGDEPAEEEAPTETAPAEEESQPPAETDEADPFGEPADAAPMESSPPAEEAPAEEASTEEEAPAEEQPSEAEDEPFGDTSEPADETPADEDDPFGDEPTEESSEPAEGDFEEAPAEEAEDAPESDEDDPFGDF